MRTTATTTAGPVRGAVVSGELEEADADREIVVFRGIPYAAAPVGPLRWRPPHPPHEWHEPRDVVAIGPAAPQPHGGPLEGLVPNMAPSSFNEDCLTLDVWTPATDAALRPVLVWFHGGAFTIGSGSLATYDGTSLAAREDVVVVTCNYRLGVLGFLLLDHPDAVANCGLLDQIAVLEWVRDNIAAFGGDPGRVTIFGESAGGGSVLSLLSTVRSEGLFHSAIVQSGATDLVLTRDQALIVADTIADAAAIDVADIEAWRSLPVDVLIDAQAAAMQSLTSTVGLMPLHPVVDGEILHHEWLDATRAGLSRDIPLLIGTTLDEMKLFSSFDPTAQTLDDAALYKRLQRMHIDPDALLAAYRTEDGATSAADRLTRVQTDVSMWMPALRIATAHAAHQPDTWMFRFDWLAANAALGACHGIDIPFPFDTVEQVGWETFVADAPHSHQLARAMQAAWAAMARQGSPATERLPVWPRFDAVKRSTMLLGPVQRVEADPRAAVRAQWSQPGTVPS